MAHGGCKVAIGGGFGAQPQGRCNRHDKWPSLVDKVYRLYYRVVEVQQVYTTHGCKLAMSLCAQKPQS